MAEAKKVFFLFIIISFIFTSFIPPLCAQEFKIEAEELAKEIVRQKRIKEQEKEMLVEEYIIKGIVLYESKEYSQALNEFLTAQQLAPYDEEVIRYIDKCRKEIDKIAKRHYLKGFKLYKKGKLEEAGDEFALVPQTSTKYEESQEYLSRIEKKLGMSVSEKEKESTMEAAPEKTKKSIKQELEELKKQLALAQLRKKAQEQAMMLEVEKAYYPPEKVERKEEQEVETPEEEQERKEAQARAELIEQMKAITVPALSLTDADIRDVIRQLMNMTGVTIILDEAALAKVAGEGTVRITFTTINPVPLLDLLELSLKTTALSYRVEPAYIWISDKETLAKEELVTKTYKLKYGVKKIREVSLTEFGSSSESEEEY